MPMSSLCEAQPSEAPESACSKGATLAEVPSIPLSSQAAAGVAGTKISKKRSRSNKKPPITVLSADVSSFRQMVQQLTGIPTSHALPHRWGGSDTPLLKPQPTRANPVGLPTLDTSSVFFKNKMSPLLQPGRQASSGIRPTKMSALPAKGNQVLGSDGHVQEFSIDALLSTAGSISNPRDSLVVGSSGSNSARGDWRHAPPPNMVIEDKSSALQVSPALLESFLLGDDDHYPKASYSTVDSWLAFDGGAMANPSPRIDVTRIAS
ncbi:hypothetical protein KP509_11G031500 [Ceratopteris richardii]|nr:hypothetical protein KP509_11G031500 [Ceratopteris richardii]